MFTHEIMTDNLLKAAQSVALLSGDKEMEQWTIIDGVISEFVDEWSEANNATPLIQTGFDLLSTSNAHMQNIGLTLLGQSKTAQLLVESVNQHTLFLLAKQVQKYALNQPFQQGVESYNIIRSIEFILQILDNQKIDSYESDKFQELLLSLQDPLDFVKPLLMAEDLDGTLIKKVLCK